MTILDPDVRAASASLVAAHKRVVKKKNQQINALQAEKGELQRALQAKTADAVKAKMQAKGVLDDAVYAHESHPLTPDAITDAMVERFRDHMWDVHDINIDEGDAVEALRAALTEPPPRPEGVEGVEEILGSWNLSYVLGNTFARDALDSLADHIAARVHVVDKEA